MTTDAMADHDSLIRLEGQVATLTATIAANNIASVERDTRIEAAVKAINGTVRGHDADLREIKAGEAERHEQHEQHQEMWSAYKIGKWVGITVGTAAIVQSAGIVTLLILQST